MSDLSEKTDIRTKIEGILKERRQFDENHMVVYPKGKPSEGRIVLSLDYVLKLESLVRASVGLVEAIQMREQKGCNDTCSNALNETLVCDCGFYAGKTALAQFAAEVEGVGK